MEKVGHNIYTATVKLNGEIMRDAIRKIIQKHGVITWEQKYDNGVIRHDVVLFPDGITLDVDTAPWSKPFDIYIKELRILCRDDGGIEGFLKMLGHLVDPSYKIDTVTVTGPGGKGYMVFSRRPAE